MCDYKDNGLCEKCKVGQNGRKMANLSLTAISSSFTSNETVNKSDHGLIREFGVSATTSRKPAPEHGVRHRPGGLEIASAITTRLRRLST